MSPYLCLTVHIFSVHKKGRQPIVRILSIADYVYALTIEKTYKGIKWRQCIKCWVAYKRKKNIKWRCTFKKGKQQLEWPFFGFSRSKERLLNAVFTVLPLSTFGSSSLISCSFKMKKKNYLESNRDFSFNKLLRHLLRFRILLLVPLLFWIFWRNRFPIYNDTHTYFSSSRSVPMNSTWRMAIHSLWRIAIHWIWNPNLILFECLNLQNKT